MINKNGQIGGTLVWIIGFIAVAIIIVALIAGTLWITGKRVAFFESGGSRILVQGSAYKASSLIATDSLVYVLNKKQDNGMIKNFFSSDISEEQKEVIEAELNSAEYCFSKDRIENVAGYALAVVSENAYFAEDLEEIFKSTSGNMRFESEHFDSKFIDIGNAAFLILPFKDQKPKYIAFFRSVKEAKGVKNVPGCK